MEWLPGSGQIQDLQFTARIIDLDFGRPQVGNLYSFVTNKTGMENHLSRGSCQPPATAQQEKSEARQELERTGSGEHHFTGLLLCAEGFKETPGLGERDRRGDSCGRPSNGPAQDRPLLEPVDKPSAGQVIR